MLRLPPTTISLSKRDVHTHLQHISKAKTLSLQTTQSLRAPLQQVRNQSPPISPTSPAPDIWTSLPSPENASDGRIAESVGSYGSASSDGHSHGTGDGAGVAGRRRSLQARISNRLSPAFEVVERQGYADLGVGEGYIPIGFLEDESALDPLRIDDEEHQRRQSEGYQRIFSLDEVVFEYGGFVESGVRESSSFAPDDISTPQHAVLPELLRLRARNPLPRSPLYRAHEAGSSPERPLTVSLSPRLPAHGTPGSLLAHPPRRPRQYRPRTQSYSYEDSERASIAFDDTTLSDDESSRPAPAGRNFREESRETSYQRGIGQEEMPSSPPLHPIIQRSPARSPTNDPEHVSEENRTFYFSSPQLPLPAPFSTIERRNSAADSLPSRSPEPSPPRVAETDNSDAGSNPLDSRTLHNLAAEHPGIQRAPSSSSTVHSIVSLPMRIISAYRSRSPGAGWLNSSPTPRRLSRRLSRTRRPSPEAAGPETPSRRLMVYDDSRPASVQPQTPRNLPEARHQSHYHPAYTAPEAMARRRELMRNMPFTERRARRNITDSPPGLDTPGFRGLYGGQENVGEDVMFDRAAQRLWTREEGRRGERSDSNTPEREMTFRNERRDS